MRAHIVFIQPLKCNIIIIGIRPNEKTVEKVIVANVKNQFKITGSDSCTIGDTSRFTITGVAGSKLHGVWYKNDKKTDSVSALLPYVYVSDSVKTDLIHVNLFDTLGNTVTLAKFESKVLSKVPKLVNVPRNREIPAGQLVSFVATTQYADSVRWHIKMLVRLVTTGATNKDTLKAIFLNTGIDTLIITAFNKYQQFSKPETIVLNIMLFTYTLQLKQNHFPDTVIAKQRATWKINVLKNGELYTGPDISYEWKTNPVKVADSMSSLTADTLQMYFGDSLPAFNLNVRRVLVQIQPNWSPVLLSYENSGQFVLFQKILLPSKLTGTPLFRLMLMTATPVGL
jgi:hypothetical protein